MAKANTYITEETTKILDSTQLKTKFVSINKKSPVKALSSELLKSGFKPSTGNNDFYGGSERYVSSDGKKLNIDFSFQSYSKASSKDAGAIGVITLKASSGESETYNFSLIAPNGDFNKFTEHYADKNNKIVKTNSWSSRWYACAKSKCVSSCLGALTTCPKSSWTVFLACVAVRCGGCVAKCVACASCNCSFWCKWAAGCCRG